MSIYSLLVGASLFLNIAVGIAQSKADFHHYEPKKLMEAENFGRSRPADDEAIVRSKIPNENICNDILKSVKHIPTENIVSTEAGFVGTNTIQCLVVTQRLIGSTEQINTLSQTTLHFLVEPESNTVSFVNF